MIQLFYLNFMPGTIQRLPLIRESNQNWSLLCSQTQFLNISSIANAESCSQLYVLHAQVFSFETALGLFWVTINRTHVQWVHQASLDLKIPILLRSLELNSIYVLEPDGLNLCFCSDHGNKLPNRCICHCKIHSLWKTHTNTSFLWWSCPLLNLIPSKES